MILENGCGTKIMTGDAPPVGRTPDETTPGLLLGHLSTRAARNAAETEAISRAYDKYVFRARRKKQGAEWLTDDLIRKVHADMFGTIWNWGGQYRRTRLDIGIDPNLIREQIDRLTEDFRSWDQMQSTMPVVEVAARLQHRLTYIRPFLHGNRRHARLMTDIFLYSRQHAIPQWPQIHLMAQGNQVREQYIRAMKKADDGDVTELMQFIEACLQEGDS